jgi:hypothetical protein
MLAPENDLEFVHSAHDAISRGAKPQQDEGNSQIEANFSSPAQVFVGCLGFVAAARLAQQQQSLVDVSIVPVLTRDRPACTAALIFGRSDAATIECRRDPG